jgi:hypothetical protein
MKTAVEWLVEKFMTENTTKEGWHEIFEQAKEMHKEQIVEHSVKLTKILISNPFETSGKTPTELMDNYFKETFKQ